MGTMIEINDTLRITKEQGFPRELDLERHLRDPYRIEDVADKVFSFTGKPEIRIYQAPPVRTFLVEDLNGKWIYWGLCQILSLSMDYEKRETSGTYRIIRLNSAEEMKQMFELTHFTNKEQNHFEEVE